LFQELIKKERTKRKLTQEQFAKHIGVKRSTVACYENGINTPSFKRVIAILEKLKVSFEECTK